MEYNQEVAFINRNSELNYLNMFLNKRPAEILFVYGPKSSGKTTLLYRLVEQIEAGKEFDVKFLNLRNILICNYDDFLRTMFKTVSGGVKMYENRRYGNASNKAKKCFPDNTVVF